MNSGETRESKHHIAVLEEEDVETFTAFCEYAYTGDYVVPPPGQREDEKEQVVHNPFKGFLRGERDAMDAAKMAGSGMAPGMGTGVESVGSPAVSAEGFQGFQGWNGFLPPPAPSPPPPTGGYGPGPGPGGYGYGDGDGVNGLGLNANSWEEMRAEVKVPEQAIDDDDDIEPFPAMPVAPETAPEKEDAKPVEQPEQPEPKQPEPEQPEKPAQQPEPEDAPEGKSKKSKKNKKDKKKKGNTEEVPELTPPTTPPAKHTENPTESVGEPGPDVAENGGQVASAEPTLAVETAGQMESKPELNQEGKEEKREEKEEEEAKKKQGKPEPQEEQQQEDRQQPPPLPPQQQQQQQQKQETFPLFTPRDQRIDMWDEFMTLDYVDQRPTYPTPRSKVAKACTPDDLPYLTFHAKVYVFATRYLIPALAQLSLHKLHRDLLYLAFPVDPDFSSAGAAGGQSSIPARADEEEEGQAELQKIKARMVLDLLYYTYSKTTRVELTIVPGCDLEREEGQEHQRPSELRKLVVHYAACRVRDLAMYGPVMNTPGTNHDRKPSSRGLRGLLDTMSELASDLVFRMM